MERGLLAGVAAYRWAAWAWMAVVLLISRESLVRPWVAAGLVGAALAYTIVATGLLRARSPALTRPAAVGVEVGLGGALIAADGWVYAPGHAFGLGQSLGIAWPLAGVLSAGIAGGAWTGAAAGVGMGASRVMAAVLNDVTDFGGQRVVSLASTTVLYVLAGGVGGHVAALLRKAEREISAARAREEVARTLHDGVLQTLAVIERRADDPELARLAHDQERELRAWIARGSDRGGKDLREALREEAARFEDAFGAAVRVVVADDLPRLDVDAAGALVGACAEALRNAGKHGAARTATVFVEPDDGGVFCSVMDDGSGFDPDTVEEGMGIRSSIRGRLEEAGGRVEIESRPGGPTEVRMWIR